MVVSRGWRNSGMSSSCLMDSFSLAKWKEFWRLVAQQCECTQHYSTVYLKMFKMVNIMCILPQLIIYKFKKRKKSISNPVCWKGLEAKPPQSGHTWHQILFSKCHFQLKGERLIPGKVISWIWNILLCQQAR